MSQAEGHDRGYGIPQASSGLEQLRCRGEVAAFGCRPFAERRCQCGIPGHRAIAIRRPAQVVGGAGAQGVVQGGGAGGQRDDHDRERPRQARPATAEDVIGHGTEQEGRERLGL